MKYRVNRKTGDRISEIGMGTSYLYQAGFERGVQILRKAYEGGINYYDLAAGHGDTFPIFREAFRDVRKNVFSSNVHRLNVVSIDVVNCFVILNIRSCRVFFIQIP